MQDSGKWRFHLEGYRSKKEEKGEEAAYTAKSSKACIRQYIKPINNTLSFQRKILNRIRNQV